ncbi:hypothetical protein DRH14_04660 [Candidatus Shapirobacteria bacterium]|nr:MAG: hypothetical protein DRH14_04660 [Candidatus Shapirobacteria bacterium]
MKITDDKIFGLEVEIYKLFWPILVFLIFFFLSLKFIILPKTEEIGGLNKKLKKIKIESRDLQNKLSYLQGEDEELLSKRISLLEMALPKEKNIYFLVNVIDQIARNYSFSTDSFSISPGNVGKELIDEKKSELKKRSFKLKEVPFSVVLYGPFDRYLDFLKGIERTLPILVINKFEMLNKGMVVKMKLNISTFSVEKNGSFPKEISLKDFRLSKDEQVLFEKLDDFNNLGFVNRGVGSSDFVSYDRSDLFGH